eukprot:Pompholyxophrys_sp_v1_NODE_283_length_866_cov_1.568434.p1 type:complete len:170 gc:universal NODE_283_length_866_cov_1.568434:1-510(+)
MKALTGFIVDEINDMERYLLDMRNSALRSKKEALVMFWFRLKCDLSFGTIAHFFGYDGDDDSSRIRCKDAFDSVRMNLIKYFVPNYLGVAHFSRDLARNECTTFSKILYGEGVHIIADTTYAYKNKSKFYSPSRKLWSVPKHSALSKHMSLVFPSGRCFDTFGPFFANG